MRLAAHSVKRQCLVIPLKVQKIPAAERNRLFKKPWKLFSLKTMPIDYRHSFSGGQASGVCIGAKFGTEPGCGVVLTSRLGEFRSSFDRATMEGTFLERFHKRTGATHRLWWLIDQSKAICRWRITSRLFKQRANLWQWGTPQELYATAEEQLGGELYWSRFPYERGKRLRPQQYIKLRRFTSFDWWLSPQKITKAMCCVRPQDYFAVCRGECRCCEFQKPLAVTLRHCIFRVESVTDIGVKL